MYLTLWSSKKKGRRLFISLGDHIYLCLVCGEDYSVGSRRVRDVIYVIVVRAKVGSCLPGIFIQCSVLCSFVSQFFLGTGVREGITFSV